MVGAVTRNGVGFWYLKSLPVIYLLQQGYTSKSFPNSSTNWDQAFKSMSLWGGCSHQITTVVQVPFRQPTKLSRKKQWWTSGHCRNGARRVTNQEGKETCLLARALYGFCLASFLAGNLQIMIKRVFPFHPSNPEYWHFMIETCHIIAPDNLFCCPSEECFFSLFCFVFLFQLGKKQRKLDTWLGL